MPLFSHRELGSSSCLCRLIEEILEGRIQDTTDFVTSLRKESSSSSVKSYPSYFRIRALTSGDSASAMRLRNSPSSFILSTNAFALSIALNTPWMNDFDFAREVGIKFSAKIGI